MGNLVTKKCDFIVTIPMKGEVSSLNASVAAGVVLYEVFKGRLGNYCHTRKLNLKWIIKMN